MGGPTAVAAVSPTAEPVTSVEPAASSEPEEPSEPAAGSAAVDALAPPAGRLFGAFVDPAGSPTNPSDGDSQAAVDAFERRIGRSLDLRRVFLRWDDPVDSTTVRTDVARGRTPVLSVRPQRRDGSLITWSQVASGAVDADIAVQAQAVRTLGAPVFLSFHHEPDMETRFGSPAEYVAAWRHYVSRMRAAGVTNAAYTWIMTPSSFGSQYVGAGAQAYWPGGDVVDWAALDAYNWLGCAPGKPTAWRPLATVVSPFRTFGAAKGKPLMLAEWGSVDDPSDPGRKAAWLREGMAALDAMPEIKAVSYFDTHGTCPWWTDSSPQTLEAFREVAGAASAHGRTTASLLPDTTGGPGPLTVTFDASASAATGHAAGQGIARWRVDFGDGSAAAEGTGSPPSALPHTFAGGTWTVTLHVTDVLGGTAARTRVIAAAKPPTVTGDGVGTGDTTARISAWVNTQGQEGTVTFHWGTTTDYGSSHTVDAAALGWSQTLRTDLTGLQPGTRYHWKVVARTDAGTTRLTGRHLDTTGPPTVLLDAPTQVTTASATLNARVHPHSLDSTVRFRLVPAGGGTTVSSDTLTVKAHTGFRWLSVPVSGLVAGTTYEVQAVGTNASGTRTATRSLTTSGTAPSGGGDGQTGTDPVVAAPTLSADGREATDTALTVVAWVGTHGLAGRVVVEWGTDTTFGGTPRTVDLPASTTGQEVRVRLEGLTPGTRHHWRVTAVTDAGSTVVANRHTDTTAPPTVQVESTLDVTATTTTLRTKVHPHSLDSTLVFELVPGDGGPVLTLPGADVAAHTGFRWFDVTLAGLAPGTTYEVRAVATNASGTSTDVRSVTTSEQPAEDPVLTIPDGEALVLAVCVAAVEVAGSSAPATEVTSDLLAAALPATSAAPAVRPAD
ncbi:hypothetical protein GCM10027194_14700 [Thalassiella azotivora]